MKEKINLKFRISTLAPVASALFAILLDVLIPSTDRLKPTDYPYFDIVMGLAAILLMICALFAAFFREYRIQYRHKICYYTVLILCINLLNLLTAKTEYLPLIYFPDFNNILKVFLDESQTLLICAAYSLRLLGNGIFWGGVIGVLTGILIGWSKAANYWLFPFFRFIGPIPSSIWIPIALLVFPTTFQASTFIIALSMWFPTTILTFSGIQNVPKQYFDVAKTLGANSLYQIIHIAVPAAFPSVFVGLFYGITSSLMALITAEMIGTKYGIGWYLNWQQQVMSWADVYAAFLVIAMICFVGLKLLFRIRDKFLVWQEGTIRW